MELVFPPPKPMLRRFWAKVRMPSSIGGCAEWVGAGAKAGRGRFNVDGRLWLAHRIAWAWCHGRVPGDMQVLHRCDNSLCVAPYHLFIGTNFDNVRDMVAKGRLGGSAGALAYRTHCKRGHEFTEANTYVIPTTGSRVCRECDRLRRQGGQLSGQMELF